MLKQITQQINPRVVQKTMENGHLSIVDLPMKNGDFPWLCNTLPEGKSLNHPIKSHEYPIEYPIE